MKNSLPLLEYSPWSPSKADLAGKCPLAFKYRYIDKIKPSAKGEHAKIGTAAHRAQELVLLGRPVEEAFATAIEEEKELTTSEIETVKTFMQAVINFKKRIEDFSAKHPVSEMLLEQQWSITPTFRGCEFFNNNGMMRGIIDFALLMDNGHLLIIDHKSGKVKSISTFATQLNIYAILGKIMYPEAKSVRCGIHFMAKEKVVWQEPRTPQYIDQVLNPWLINYLNDKALGVEGFDARLGWYCNWCDYKEICPAKQEDDA